jgi:hypothetical protein
MPHSSRRKGAGMSKPPETMWLQWYGDATPEESERDPLEATWCEDKIYNHDVEYRRVTPNDEKCCDIVRRMAEWAGDDPASDNYASIATDAAKLWAKMQEDAKGGDGEVSV